MSKYRITLDGRIYEMEIERIDSQGETPRTMTAAASPETPRTPAPKPQEKPVSAAPAVQPSGAGVVKSPMPGTIVRVNAREGDSVKREQSVLVLEAMKMENDIAAPADGIIKAIYVTQGDTVQGGSPLFEIGE